MPMPELALRALRCPFCGAELAGTGAPGQAVRCLAGHSFDVSRQGYVNMLAGRAPAGTETAEMVAARADLFTAGHLSGITAALIEHVPPLTGILPGPAQASGTPALALDVGAGTGHHLAAVLDAVPGSIGIALDVSKAAARVAARAHPAMASVVADVWRRLPLADDCADLLLDVFAPRNGAEFHRVLRPSGTLLVVTPAPNHLAELVGPLGLVKVDAAKPARLERSLGQWFEPARQSSQRYGLWLTRAEAALFVAMGPSAWHTDPAGLAATLQAWSEPIAVTVAVDVTSLRPRVA